MKAGRIDVVVSWHTDCLHRSPVELEEYIGLEVPTHTAKAGPLDLATPSGRMVARQVGAVAPYESEHKSARASRKYQQLAKAGEYRGGARPFGYQPGGLELHPVESVEVQDMYRRVLTR